MSKMTDVFRDTVKHTHGLGLFSKLKLTGTKDDTKIASHSDDKNVLFYGTFKEAIPEFAGHEFGLTRLDVLSGYVIFPEFVDDQSVTSVGLHQPKTGDPYPISIDFKAGNGSSASYRLSAIHLLPSESLQQWEVRAFNGAEFEINFMPSLKSIKELSSFAGILGSYQSTFSPVTKNGDLYFNIGDTNGACDRISILIQKDVGAELTNKMEWKLENLLPILKLGENSTMVLSINDDFLLQVVVDTSIGTYTYALPGLAGV